MNKLVATAVVLAGTCTAAFAADLPSRMAPPVYAPAPPIFTWTGAYLGVNAGYAFNSDSRFSTFNGVGLANGVPVQRPGAASVSSDGFTAGGQIGYNYQFGAGNGIVVGLEADAAYTDLGKTNLYNLGGSVSTLHSDMDFLGTVRGRVGYAFDRFMVYGTGGLAYGDVTQRSNFYSAANGLLTYTGGHSGIDLGYTYGGGIEYAVPTTSFLNSLNFFHSSAVTIKAEYLHYDLGSNNVAVIGTGNNGTAGSAYTQRIRTDGDLARIGINYKF